jgi:hypothetical protein
MESYMAHLGYNGAIWESKALDMIIFRPGNAFTLPAGLTILFLLAQSFFVIYVQVSHFTSSHKVAISFTAFFTVLLVLLVVKTITVDFHNKIPQIFDDTKMLEKR